MDGVLYNAIIKSPENKMVVNLTLLQTIAIIGNIELSLRHPKNKGHSANIARGAAEYLIKELLFSWPEIKEEKDLLKAWEKVFLFKIEEKEDIKNGGITS
ncbi:hypothetical protein LCGC14_0867680 [marine sediment metagenome]|uniref:Uncharacterized protein n=1 Tax=marine sediment metagenome TaxID=412755 RepID=A0A0F9P5K4_9ZZZZ